MAVDGKLVLIYGFLMNSYKKIVLSRSVPMMDTILYCFIVLSMDLYRTSFFNKEICTAPVDVCTSALDSLSVLFFLLLVYGTCFFVKNLVNWSLGESTVVADSHHFDEQQDPD